MRFDILDKNIKYKDYAKKTLRFFVYSMLAMVCLFTACSSDDDNTTHAPLTFEQTYYEKPLMMSEPMRRLAFTGGSGDFPLSVSDPNVLDAEIGNGTIVLTAKEKGRTNIVVRDNVDDRSVTIQVKVVDTYLCFQVGNPLPDGKPDYSPGDYLFLVNDSERSVYCFDESFNLKSVDHGYSFSYSKGEHRFYFSLPLAGNMFTYDITTNQWSFLVQVLPRYLGFSWDGLDMQSRATNQKIVSDAGPILLMAVDVATGDKYNFIVRTSIEMPYGILD